MSPPPCAQPATVAALRADLVAAGWDVGSVEALLGPVAAAALHRDQLAPARRALRRRPVLEPVAVLTALFVLGQCVPRRAAAAALPRTGVDAAVRANLVHAAGPGDDDPVTALVDLRPHAVEDAAWWIASDLAAAGRPLAPDHVLGVGGASVTLAGLMARTPVASVLDLGTGSGVQALHAARHARRVVATDTSRRALAFAAFNLALAGEAADLRRGSLLEPVAGERFDQVVSNPPFVVTPRGAGVPGWEYRETGLVGDDVTARLISGMGGALAPGGSAQLLGNWEHRRGHDWRARVGAWLDACGLDAWVIQREVSDPADYAATWIRDALVPPGEEFDSLVQAWLDDFEARDVEAVGSGFVVLHAPPDGERRPWRRVEELRSPLPGGLGQHVAAVLAAREQVAALDDAGLLARRLVVADDVTEERHARPGAAGPEVILLRAGGGVGRVVAVDAALAGVVGACDGELALGRLAVAVAALLDIEAAALTAQLLPAVRELLADGLLLAGER